MKYRSTRGKDTGFSFEDVVMTGLASDGGLFIPEGIPTLPEDWRNKWENYTFQQLSFAILRLFIDQAEIPDESLREIIEKSYSTFTNKDVTPMVQIDSQADTWILELFHGPTFAFKDVALQFLGNLFEYFLKRRNSMHKDESSPVNRITVVGATSGDTGGAAIYGLMGKENVSLFIMHPNNRVSTIQKAQMTTVDEENIHNIAIEGTFDDCQDIVKLLFGRKEFNQKYSLGAINSINWARILAQIVYYFHSYFSLVRAGKAQPKIVFVTPTGNFGDILAGHYAQRLGLPIAKLVIATNSNDILDRFFKSGAYEKGDGGVKETPSPAMDILVSSNFERFLWYLARDHESKADDLEGKGNDAGRIVAKWMDDLKLDGTTRVSGDAHKAARQYFLSGSTNNQKTYETIRAYYSPPEGSSHVNYLMDPHTAVGVNVANTLRAQLIEELGGDDFTTVCLSTAHPAKFVEAIEESLDGCEPKFEFSAICPKQFVGILDLKQKYKVLPNSADAVASHIEHTLL
ncbi:Threonine synthase [Zancudomyces culisetae]|uniref:Threonine synthase n=1 Tax=Zancudomyces culisetae TaxID=1213189 RepID=A0A1R1PYW6_ZANCU|nr:Threonine synthase [Zancudomyces culisetae]|eukprot:OMH86158.1 Threonine synthase [Zancudomyces culisetae]